MYVVVIGSINDQQMAARILRARKSRAKRRDESWLVMAALIVVFRYYFNYLRLQTHAAHEVGVSRV